MEFIYAHWRSGVEILILWVLLYQLYRSFRATRGARIFLGAVMVLAVVSSLAYLLQLKVIAWLLVHSAIGIAFTLAIIFQAELRMALEKIGSSGIFRFNQEHKIEFAEELTDAVMQLSHKRIGALFALEREISLDGVGESGVVIDAAFAPELVMTIFYPKTTLHDGGMVLQKNRIASAACVFPLSQNNLNDRSLGLRHRAALGISEDTDAVAIVVSEETGTISVAVDGELKRNFKKKEFREFLEKIFIAGNGEQDDEKDTKEQLVGEADRAADGGDDLVPD